MKAEIMLYVPSKDEENTHYDKVLKVQNICSQN